MSVDDPAKEAANIPVKDRGENVSSMDYFVGEVELREEVPQIEVKA